mmetsp:Transcript_8287/g.8443  ORF Transcript_8287/g.8443 Transcript_8287/m.8443 type:complete len:398 (+) Transcript_8287:103-1296(+)|eukprot:CAMPEP_0182420986 /NCGR_PEP_ID=MMETSP1167-20130531/6126_1 /TAXON_ID=2988 /ORGANISM="Mallomonas Sp, Strain CCMP3275" /LENGTH=397 /DNA_ID=CAMNT_0024597623 /DNA_START=102 /DNA_END=1295 /DNA_ORIENTATION=-
MSPIQPSIKITFLEDGWKQMYFRNNGVNGHKNLRCFPSCRTSGHSERAFCGRPVHVQINSIGYDLSEVLLIAQFSTFSPNENNFNDDIPLNESEVLTRCQPASMKPLFIGEVLKSETMYSGEFDGKIQMLHVVFNRQSRPYSYEWTGAGRAYLSSEHALKVVALQKVTAMDGSQTNRMLAPLVQAMSPPFSIKSSRRRKVKVPPGNDSTSANMRTQSCLPNQHQLDPIVPIRDDMNNFENKPEKELLDQDQLLDDIIFTNDLCGKSALRRPQWNIVEPNELSVPQLPTASKFIKVEDCCNVRGVPAVNMNIDGQQVVNPYSFNFPPMENVTNSNYTDWNNRSTEIYRQTQDTVGKLGDVWEDLDVKDLFVDSNAEADYDVAIERIFDEFANLTDYRG